MNKVNIAHSVSQKLLNVAKARGISHNLVLVWYGLERLLYRLSKSKHSNKFVLKGAMLFAVWTKQPLRPTKDLDLMAYGDASADYLKKVFTEICKAKVENDGIEFDTDSIEINEIRKNQEYQGQRIKLLAKLGKARIRLQIDIGFGDAVTPAPAKIKYPVLLESSAPLIKAYSKETVVAEKFHAMVILGIVNSRMKDFYDIWVMSKQFDFGSLLLTEAIEATFERRKTPLPEDLPMALTKKFSQDTAISQRWKAFANKLNQADNMHSFDQIICDIKDFLLMPLENARHKKLVDKKWQNGKWN